MKFSGSVVAVTGGAGGLGAAICRLAQRRGAAGIAVIDRDADRARSVAVDIGGMPVTADVTSEPAIADAVEAITARFGRIDIFVSNAGLSGPSDPFTGDAWFDLAWRLHVMSNLYAARCLLPSMLRRGSGHLVSTASVNALTSNPVHLAYAITKHAQLALAEWLAMTYRSRGIEVTCFCPKGMITPMLLENAQRSPLARNALASAVTPEQAAEALADAVEAGRFMVTTYPPVWDDLELKARDYDAYVAGLQKLHDEFVPEFGAPPAEASGTPPQIPL
jgi:NAD(P)-dependent dehydrogenase (short-subunit alcohol dehydrogenase family)